MEDALITQITYTTPQSCRNHGFTKYEGSASRQLPRLDVHPADLLPFWTIA